MGRRLCPTPAPLGTPLVTTPEGSAPRGHLRPPDLEGRKGAPGYPRSPTHPSDLKVGVDRHSSDAPGRGRSRGKFFRSILASKFIFGHKVVHYGVYASKFVF